MVAVAWAFTVNNNVDPVLTSLLGATAASRWAAAISAPVVEETLKAIGTASVILIGREFVRRPAGRGS